MTKREARKVALRIVAALARGDEPPWTGNLSDEDTMRVAREREHIADELTWTADGRPER